MVVFVQLLAVTIITSLGLIFETRVIDDGSTVARFVRFRETDIEPAATLLAEVRVIVGVDVFLRVKVLRKVLPVTGLAIVNV